METKNMLYIVSEYASQGEIFGKSRSTDSGQLYIMSVSFVIFVFHFWFPFSSSLTLSRYPPLYISMLFRAF